MKFAATANRPNDIATGAVIDPVHPRFAAPLGTRHLIVVGIASSLDDAPGRRDRITVPDHQNGIDLVTNAVGQLKDSPQRCGVAIGLPLMEVASHLGIKLEDQES